MGQFPMKKSRKCSLCKCVSPNCSAIQEETLRTYIFNSASSYDSLSIENLGSMFSLPVPKVRNVISKMIYQEELLASLDASEEFVLLDHSAAGTNITKMEHLSGFFADKLFVLADANEKMQEAKKFRKDVKKN